MTPVRIIVKSRPRASNRAADATYIFSPLNDDFYLPIHASTVSQPAALAPGWMQPPTSCLDEIVGSGLDCTEGWQAEKKRDFV